jgi:hypothetical protein
MRIAEDVERVWRVAPVGVPKMKQRGAIEVKLVKCLANSADLVDPQAPL